MVKTIIKKFIPPKLRADLKKGLKIIFRSKFLKPVKWDEAKFLLKESLFAPRTVPNKKPIVAMVSNKSDAPSETFIRLQRDMIDAKVNYYSNGVPPASVNGKDLKTPYNIALAEIYKENTETNLNDSEILVATSFLDEKTDIVWAQFGTDGAGILNVCEQLNLPLIVHFRGYDISVRDIVEVYKAKYQEMFKFATYIVAVSKNIKTALINLGCPEEKIIHNPSPPRDAFYNIKPTFSKKLFLGAGRLTPKKSPQNTILAFKKVLDKHPDAKLILAGDGVLLDQCKQLVKKCNIEKSVSFPGVYKPEELRKWLSEAAAFVQHSMTAPNGDMEGTPLVVSEASMAGLPVISTLHAGIPDIIINGKTGLLVEEGDIDGMAENMIWVLDNPENAKEMGRIGKENMWKNFNAAKHLAVCNDIILKTINRIGKEITYNNKFDNYEERVKIKESDYPEYLKSWYYKKTGLNLNLEHPLTFNEKINWLKLNDNLSIKGILADKHRVKEWVSEQIGKEYIIQQLGVWDDVNKIDLDMLPDKFVLKTNHGSATNIIVTDKKNFNFKKAKEQLNKWLKLNWAFHANEGGLELQYRDIKPMVFAEQYIEGIDKNLVDYKFQCVNGEPIYCGVYTKDPEGLKIYFTNLNYELQPFNLISEGEARRYNKKHLYNMNLLKQQIEKPKNFEQMVELARILSKGFIYVRVDLYNLKGKIYFGEMTFYHGNGINIIYPYKYERLLGDMIPLPTDKV